MQVLVDVGNDMIPFLSPFVLQWCFLAPRSSLIVESLEDNRRIVGILNAI